MGHTTAARKTNSNAGIVLCVWGIAFCGPVFTVGWRAASGVWGTRDAVRKSYSNAGIA